RLALSPHRRRGLGLGRSLSRSFSSSFASRSSTTLRYVGSLRASSRTRSQNCANRPGGLDLTFEPLSSPSSLAPRWLAESPFKLPLPALDPRPFGSLAVALAPADGALAWVTLGKSSRSPIAQRLLVMK